MKEKSTLKGQIKEMTTKGIDVNQVYKQVREDLKIDDISTVILFNQLFFFSFILKCADIFLNMINYPG
jgi:hypothetical protein